MAALLQNFRGRFALVIGSRRVARFRRLQIRCADVVAYSIHVAKLAKVCVKRALGNPLLLANVVQCLAIRKEPQTVHRKQPSGEPLPSKRRAGRLSKPSHRTAQALPCDRAGGHRQRVGSWFTGAVSAGFPKLARYFIPPGGRPNSSSAQHDSPKRNQSPASSVIVGSQSPSCQPRR